MSGSAPALRAATAIDLSSDLPPTPMLPGEDEDAYDRHLQAIHSAARPTDAIEAFWVEDIAAASWDVRRWRTYKAATINNYADKALSKNLEYYDVDDNDIDDTEADDENFDTRWDWLKSVLLDRWRSESKEDRDFAKQWFDAIGLDINEVIAEAMVDHQQQVEFFEGQIARARNQFDTLIREIDRHRDAVAKRIRNAFQDIKDAEFDVVASGHREAAE